MRPHEWRTPSQAQPKTAFGHENVTRFYVAARLDDGHLAWKGWFDDRDDFDAFLWSMARGTLHQDREIQRLPTPWWNPDLQEYPVRYIIAVTRSITTTSGSNQTDSVPTDWGNVTNQIDVLASGASGANKGTSGFGGATGGSGAAWSRQTNVSLTPGGSATFRLSAGGVGQATQDANGNAGADAWYNGTTLAGASVGAKGGVAGTFSTTSPIAGSAGGAAGSGVGSTKNSGGASGSATFSFTNSCSGGGGAALFNGNGNASANATSGSSTAGGSGDAGSGGAGGAINGTNGSPGAEYGGGLGAGGGGGAQISNTSAVAGSGGTYGAGGGGYARAAAGGTSGAGAQALIFQTYTPLVAVRFTPPSPDVARRARRSSTGWTKDSDDIFAPLVAPPSNRAGWAQVTDEKIVRPPLRIGALTNMLNQPDPYVFVTLIFKEGWVQGDSQIRPRQASSKFGGIAIDDPSGQNDQPPIIVPFAEGWAIQPPQPPAFLRGRRGAPLEGDDGNQGPYKFWLNSGWEVAPHQPQHPRPEKAGAIMPLSFIEVRYANFFAVFEQTFAQPYRVRINRFASVDDKGDDGLSDLVPFFPRADHTSSVDLRPKQWRAAAIAPWSDGQDRYQFWRNAGWEFTPTLARHPRPERGGLVQFLAPVEGRYNFLFTGWPAVLPEIPRPQRRAGTFPVGDVRFEPLVRFTAVADSTLPMLPKIIRRQDPQQPRNLDVPLVRFFDFGWPVQPPQPPAPRVFERGAIMRGDDGTQFTLIQFFTPGWEVAPHQPQHPRPERAGAIMRGDDGNYDTFAFIAVPNVWGYEPSAPHPGRRKVIGFPAEDVIAAQFAVFRPHGWEIPPPLFRSRPPHRMESAFNIDGRKEIFYRPLRLDTSVEFPKPRRRLIIVPESVLRARDLPVGWAEPPVTVRRAFRTRGGGLAGPEPTIRPPQRPTWGWADLPLLVRRPPRRPAPPADAFPGRPIGLRPMGWEIPPPLLNRSVRRRLDRDNAFPFSRLIVPASPAGLGLFNQPMIRSRPNRAAGFVWSFLLDIPPLVPPPFVDLAFAFDDLLWRAIALDEDGDAGEAFDLGLWLSTSRDASDRASQTFDTALFEAAAHVSIDGTQQIMGTYEIQTALQIVGTFANSITGAAADPTTVTLFLKDPQGSVQQLVYGASGIVKDSVGNYHYNVTPTIHGVWTYKWQGVGAVVATSPDSEFTVKSSTLIAG